MYVTKGHFLKMYIMSYNQTPLFPQDPKAKQIYQALFIIFIDDEVDVYIKVMCF